MRSIGYTQWLYGGLLLLLAMVFTPIASATATPSFQPKVLLITPNTEGFPFWQRVKQFTQVVSNSLGVELHSYALPYDRSIDIFSPQGELSQLLSEQLKPDFVISLLWYNKEANLIDLTERLKIPLITFNIDLSPALRQTLGKPRAKHKYWLAHISPDDTDSGKQLAKQLFAQLDPQTPANLLVLGGDEDGWPGINRIEGLQQQLKLHPQIKLLETVTTDWSSFVGRKVTTKALKRYGGKNIKYIWAAADFIALGAINAIKKQGLTPGKDILIGGIDWNKESFEPIRAGEMAVSLGGHFIEGGKALILAYDLLHGHDFAEELGVVLNTQMAPMDINNINHIEPGINYNHWKSLDFKPLSKTHNPKLKRYKLSLNDLLQFKLTHHSN
jgi:ABC-type sugar transport system substrate-binding protein